MAGVNKAIIVGNLGNDPEIRYSANGNAIASISVATSVMSFEYKGKKINILDTPGHKDFAEDTYRTLTAVDSVILVVDVAKGVEAQTRKLMQVCRMRNTPVIIFVNKMDRAGANFDRVVQQIKDRLQANIVPIQYNIGAEEDFKGVVDLINMRAIYWNEEDQGLTFDSRDIPEDLLERCNELREEMLEAAAEANEELMDTYLESGDLSVAQIKEGLRIRSLDNELIVGLCGSAFKNKGVQAMLDAVVEFLPAPDEVKAITGVIPNNSQEDEEEDTRKSSDDEPFSALAFKIATDPFVGTLTFIRVYSGVLSVGDAVINSTKSKKERVGRMVQMHSNNREEIKEVRAGDIAACIGLKDITTGDTLSDASKPIVLERMDFPEPVISVAVEPKSKPDQEKMSLALGKLAQEDPSFRVTSDEESGQTIISGMGELHLDVLVDRMRREFSVEANIGKPQVAYRETIKETVEVEGKFVRQSGGKGQYGHVWLKLEPLGLDDEYEFVDKIVGGVIPKEYIPAVNKGIQEQMQNGVIAGYPLLALRATLYDGSFHDVDSNEMAFKDWMNDQKLSLAALFPTIQKNDIQPLDLSVSSTWIGHENEFNDLDLFQYKINKSRANYRSNSDYHTPRRAWKPQKGHVFTLGDPPTQTRMTEQQITF